MNRKTGKVLTMMLAVVVLSVTVFELSAHARAGARRSSGSRGTQNYSQPASPAPQQSPSRQQSAPAPSPTQQPAGGGFLRNMAGGLMGGMLGGLLFSSLAGASSGMGGLGGSGIGLFEILLLAGGGFLLFRFMTKKPALSPATASPSNGHQRDMDPVMASHSGHAPLQTALETGLEHIRRMDPSFDPSRFQDGAMDSFFQIQGAWMNRELAPVAGLLTPEMRGILQADLDQLLRDRQINKLENIAVRRVEIVEAGQEAGHDYITTLIYANLLDFTVAETTGAVVSGSKSEPVKFQEYWTFTRQVGNNPWLLSAIQQQ